MRPDDFMHLRGIPYDEQTMQQHMRAQALKGGWSAQEVFAVQAEKQAVRALHRAARAVNDQGGECSVEVDWILKNARVAEALFTAQAGLGHTQLPAFSTCLMGL